MIHVDESALVQAEERLSKQARIDLKNAIIEVGKSEQGRLLLWHIVFNICKVNEDAMGGEEVVYRHMGRRSAGLQLLTEIEDADISIHLKMIKDMKIKTENERLLIKNLVKEIEEEQS